MNIIEYLKEHLVYLDGGMGTLLQAQGLQPGELPERWNLTRPEVIIDIHKAVPVDVARIAVTEGIDLGEHTVAEQKDGVIDIHQTVSVNVSHGGS